jgi:hypothetical protein
MKTLVFTLLFYIAFQVNAQVTDTTKLSNVKLSLEGMIGFSVGQNFYSLNVGGPSLFLHINKNLKIGIGALPSIFLYNDKLGARLGVSPRVDYKNIVLIAPFFHRDVTGEWIPSVGLGYKFHKK